MKFLKKTLVGALTAVAIGCGGTANKPKAPAMSPGEYPAAVEHDMAFVKHVKAFARKQYGFTGNHYERYIPQAPDKLYWLLVTEPTILPDERTNVVRIKKDMQYRKPIQGHAFFTSRVDNLRDEKKYYKGKGFDVRYRVLTDFNTGSNDYDSPVTDDFRERSKPSQARVIPHELCHAWVGTTIERIVDKEGKEKKRNFPSILEEPFCTMIGAEASLEYFAHTRGENSKAHKEAQAEVKQYLIKARNINNFFDELSAVYFHMQMTMDERLEKKNEILFFAKAAFGRDVNNALLWERHVYSHYYFLFRQLHQSHGNDVKKTLEVMRECPPKKRHALQYIVNNFGTHPIEEKTPTRLPGYVRVPDHLRGIVTKN